MPSTTTRRLRPSLTPGTVLILLSGKHAGRRVILLGQLPSGLLLVSGPYKFNGVPLRRVDPAYVIATKTKIDLSSFKLPAGVTDEVFQRKRSEGVQKEGFFARGKAVEITVSEERKKLQQEVDAQLVPLLKKVPLMRSYLGARFAIRKGQSPHAMVF